MLLRSRSSTSYSSRLTPGKSRFRRPQPFELFFEAAVPIVVMYLRAVFLTAEVKATALPPTIFIFASDPVRIRRLWITYSFHVLICFFQCFTLLGGVENLDGPPPVSVWRYREVEDKTHTNPLLATNEKLPTLSPSNRGSACAVVVPAASFLRRTLGRRLWRERSVLNMCPHSGEHVISLCILSELNGCRQIGQVLVLKPVLSTHVVLGDAFRVSPRRHAIA